MALDLYVVQHVLVLVGLVRLVHPKVFQLNLVLGQDVCVFRNYGHMAAAALSTLYHSSSYSRK